MQHHFKKSLAIVVVILSVCIWLGISSRAEKTSVTQSVATPLTAQAVGFGISPAVLDLPPPKGQAIEPELFRKTESNRPVVKNPLNTKQMKEIAPGAEDLFVKDEALAPAANSPSVGPTPAVNFEGLSSQDNVAATGGTGIPPDTVGDVGPNHYVQMTNNLVRIYNKSGAPLVLPFRLSSITNVAGGPCVNTDDGDPIVNYDPLADRWILSQFCVDPVPGHQVFAVSTTPDPTGTYFVYDFVNPNAKFQDYPHVAVWPDAYYMSTNQFASLAGGFVGAGAFAYNRAKMLAGDPTASYIYFDEANICPDCGGQLATDLDGTAPPPANTPNLFMEFRADEFGDPTDALRIFAFIPNFANPSASTFAQIGADLPLAAFDPRSPSGTSSDIEQPDTTIGLDSLAGRLMHKISYRNLGTSASPTNSYVLNFTVNVSGVAPGTSTINYQSGIRWTELRRSAAGAMSVFQQGTQATNPGTPNGGTNLWMGSVAQDNQGNIVLGYSTSGGIAPDYPSIRYAGRLATDPPGQLAQGETVGHLGTGFQGNGTGNRWGDYSAMNVDSADDCSFWYTQEYRVAANNGSPFFWNTRVIGGFKFPTCNAPARGSITGTITSCTGGAPVNTATVSTADGFVRTTGANGAYTINNVPAGTYTVSATKFGGFSTATQSGVNVTAGGATAVNLCLSDAPLIVSSNATLVSESCSPGNGVIDPGETVTVAFAVQNTGRANTTNLTGALQATGGVTNPGGAQNYGVVVAGGAAVTRNFTFTASPTLGCGINILPSLVLADGASSLGNASYSLPTGVPGGNAQIFPYTGPPVDIPDDLAAGVDIPITISGASGTVSDLDFRVDGTASSSNPLSTTVGLNHSYVGDLQFRLTSPAGTTVLIMSAGGGAPDCAANNIHQMTLNDEAAANMTCPLGGDGGGPLTGPFRPSNPLSAFDGQAINGTWTLNIADVGPIDLGTMRAFSLAITSRACCASAPIGTVQFNTAAFSANEGANTATVTVTRTGATTAASVDYTTPTNDAAFTLCNSNTGVASARCDFIATSGTLNFAAGETSKTFAIPVIDDIYTENNETLNLTLSNPTGAGLGTQPNAALTISDNDPVAANDNFFVARLDGAQEAPPNNSTANGLGTVALTQAATQATVNMSFSGLGSAQTAAHIHGSAPVGQNAPVLFNLGTGQISGLVLNPTAAQIAQMRAGMFYFNVHTNNFPNGEIRGQIVNNPLENARFFVRQQYYDFLSREPDTAGFDFWTGEIVTTCGADLACTRQRRVDVSNAFFFELEFQQTGAYVYRLYRAAFGGTQPFPNPETATLPNYAVFVTDRARVVGGASLPAAQLALADAFVQRSEFTARYPTSQTPAQYVDALLGTIQAASGANLTSQRDALIALHNSAGRGAVLYRLADDNAQNPINNRAFIDAEYNRAFVLTQYYGYLRRDADLGGFNFWFDVVNRFPLRSVTGQNAMVCAFITAQEYEQRFSAGVPRTNAECPPAP